MAPVRSGDLSGHQRRDLDRAIRAAESRTRFEFSVYVGPTKSTPAEYAERLLSALAAPNRTLLLMVDPERRIVQICTGSDVRARISDAACQQVADSLAEAFAGGNGLWALTGAVDALAAAAQDPSSPGRVRSAANRLLNR